MRRLVPAALLTFLAIAVPAAAQTAPPQIKLSDAVHDVGIKKTKVPGNAGSSRSGRPRSST